MRGLPGIVPTWRAVAVVAAGAPVAAACAAVRAELWVVGPAWILAALIVIAADLLATRRPGGFTAIASLPPAIETGRPAQASFRFGGRPPSALDAILETDGLLDVQPPVARLRPGSDAVDFTLLPRRRGLAALARLHLRWHGPLGLIGRIEARPLGCHVPVVPAIGLVREEAIRLFSRNAAVGSAPQRERAESMEFHALREFRRGDDPRTVSWRQSARHGKLLVRETEAERNRTVMLALDTGRLMCEPLAGGLPRLDHALNAALVLAYAALKLGDRVGLFAFGARPVLSSGTCSGTAAFATLQHRAAALDYSTEETNFVLGLSALGTALGGTAGGRALVVVLTDFADSTGAELMIETVGRLLQRHVVLFVTFRDDELADLAEAPPDTADDVARAVVAGSLLAERGIVLARLRRLGVEVLDVPARTLGPAAVRRYLDLKRRDRF